MSCRHYETDDPCIEIRASNVELQGNGHTLDGSGYGTGISVTETVRNVTIADLTVRENVDNVRLEDVTDVQLTNVTSRNPDPTGSGIAVSDSRQVEIRNSDLHAGGAAGAAVTLDRSERVHILDNSFTQGNRAIDAEETNRSAVTGNYFTDVQYAVDVESGSGNEISNNTIENRPELGIDVGGHNNTVTGNTITLASNGIDVSGSAHTIANNDVTRIEAWAAAVQGSNHTVTNNRFSGGEETARSGGALELAGENHTVAANTLSGVHGVYATNVTGPLSINRNHLSGSYQIRVAEHCADAADGAAVVDVHGNTFSVAESAENTYGILNEDDDVLNATGNYWGAESGPSSPDGENVTDPITGTAADGSGSTVSKGVHFDPWLHHQPSTRTAD